jgi:hypothetical protein
MRYDNAMKITPSSSEPENQRFVSALRGVCTASSTQASDAIKAAKQAAPLPKQKYSYVPAKGRS